MSSDNCSPSHTGLYKIINNNIMYTYIILYILTRNEAVSHEVIKIKRLSATKILDPFIVIAIIMYTVIDVDNN